VANAAFRGEHNLVLVCVAADRLDAPLRYESSDAGDELFPHLYGPLDLDAVVGVIPFVEGRDGYGAARGARIACVGAGCRAWGGYPSRVRRYHVTTFGCQMNAHDSERI